MSEACAVTASLICVIVAVATPLITPSKTTGRSICLPVQEGRRGNPVLFSRVHFPALSALTGDRGGKAVIRANPGAVKEVAVADPGIHLDFDNP